ncbi:MAG: glycosyltransferase family 39 protein, partial [Candidatus Omnitrophota bacterium]
PPVFPFLLSIVYRFFGMNFFAMKLLVVLFWEASLCLLFLLLRNRLPPIIAMCLLFLVGAHPFIYFFLNNILSETSFLFFTLLSLYCAEYFYNNKLDRPGNQPFFIALGVMMYCAYGTRSIGAILVPALITYDLIKYRQIHRETLFSVLTCAFLMILQLPFGVDTSGYFPRFGFTFASVFDKAAFYITSFYSLNTTGAERVFFWVKSCFCFLGFYGAVRKRFSLLEIFCFFYVGIILAYALPHTRITLFDAHRLFLPLVLFYFYYLFFGIQEVSSFLSKKFSQTFLLIIFVVLLFTQVGTIIHIRCQNDFTRLNVANKEAGELFEYVKKNTKPQDVFIFIKPRTFTLFTQRAASTYHEHKKRQDFMDYLASINARYVVVMKGHDFYLTAFVKAYKKHFLKVYENLDFQVFKLLIF